MSDTNNQDIINKSDLEFVGQQDLAGKRIEHVILLQDKLRNHIVNVESINQLLESQANVTKDKDKKTQLLKSMSYNYDRLIELYKVYQLYEQTIQRYHIHVTDTINKKYQMEISKLKSKEPAETSADFFRNLNDLLIRKHPLEIEEKTKIDDPNFNL